MTTTAGQRLATDLRNAYEWHDRQSFEAHLQRMVAMIDGEEPDISYEELQTYFRQLQKAQEIEQNERN